MRTNKQVAFRLDLVKRREKATDSRERATIAPARSPRPVMQRPWEALADRHLVAVQRRL